MCQLGNQSGKNTRKRPAINSCVAAQDCSFTSLPSKCHTIRCQPCSNSTHVSYRHKYSQFCTVQSKRLPRLKVLIRLKRTYCQMYRTIVGECIQLNNFCKCKINFELNFKCNLLFRIMNLDLVTCCQQIRIHSFYLIVAS